MREFRELLDFYPLPLLLGLNREEIDHLFSNLKKVESISKSNYNAEDVLYLAKAKKWEKEMAFEKTLNTLSLIRSVEGKDEEVKELIRSLTPYPESWEINIVNSYVANYAIRNFQAVEKVERLLKGLKFHESLLSKEYFICYMNETGIENFRKFYGKSDFKGERIHFLNLTDDLEFIEKIPEKFTSENTVFKESYGIEELKSLRDENLDDKYYFSNLMDCYRYKEYEDELIELWQNNKEFFEKIDDFRLGYEIRNLDNVLKIFRFWVSHEDLLEDLSPYDNSLFILTRFLNEYFAFQDDEEKLVKILEKILDKGYDIYKYYQEMAPNYKRAYIYDVIFRLNSKASTKRLVSLCGFAAMVGLDDERFIESLKVKPKKDVESEKREKIEIDCGRVFFEEYGIETEDYEIKRRVSMNLKKEDKEKVKFLLQRNYPKKYIYESLFSIDNIFYLVRNGYDLKYWDFPCVKRYYTKENLDDFIWNNLSISEASSLYVYEIEEGLKEMVKSKEEKNNNK